MMSNKSAPSKKFVQMFVLTPQTNGYYVLNDIFRYLNDEEDEIIEDEPAQEPAPQEEASAPPPPTSDIEQESANNETGVEQVDAKLEEVVNTDAELSVNGASTEPPVEEPLEREPSPEAPEEVDIPVPAEDPPEPEHTPAQSPPKAPTPAPAAEVPTSKKTWANLVGSKAAAVPAVPISTPAVPSQPKAQKSPPSVTQPQVTSSTTEQGGSPASQGNEWQTAEHNKKQSRPQNKAATEGNVLGYIKNVTEKIEASKLRSALEQYGEVKYFDVFRPRASRLLTKQGQKQADSESRTARSLNLPHQLVTMLLLLQTLTRSGPNRSMLKNADHGQTHSVVATRVSTEGGPARDGVEAARVR
jgi:Nuclear transport factor 2 (NTF2) domain